MHPILDYIRANGGDAVDNDGVIEGEVPRFEHYSGRRQWVHFIVLYTPRNAFVPEHLLKRLAFKWDAGYLVGVVNSTDDFSILICTYRQWLNTGECGFFGTLLPSYMDHHKELYHPR